MANIRDKVILLVLLLAGSSHRIAAQTPPAEIGYDVVRETVTSAGALVASEYFDAEVAAHVERFLAHRLEDGSYASISTIDLLAKELTLDLLAASNDKHLTVRLVHASGPEAKIESRATQGKRSNFGVRRVEILEGNVGYISVTAFYRLAEARDALSAAMCLLQNADALIIDVRENGGGSPETVAFLAGHFFNEESVALFDVVDRSGNVNSYGTDSAPLGRRNATRPVYVLTSKRTFSAGEGIAFILQEQRRASVVGERTAGAANPGRPYPINSRFEITIPTGRVRGALSRENWEGRGVSPDINVSASDALRTAHILALRTIFRQSSSESDRETLHRQIDLLETNGH